MPPSLIALLESIPTFDSRISELLDTYNNFVEQMRSIQIVCENKEFPHNIPRIVEKHPEWQERIKAKLDIELSETIEDIQGLLIELEKVVLEITTVARDPDICYVSSGDDAKVLADHLAIIINYYKSDINEIDPSSPKPIKSHSILTEWKAKIAYDRLLQGLKMCHEGK